MRSQIVATMAGTPAHSLYRSFDDILSSPSGSGDCDSPLSESSVVSGENLSEQAMETVRKLEQSLIWSQKEGSGSVKDEYLTDSDDDVSSVASFATDDTESPKSDEISASGRKTGVRSGHGDENESAYESDTTSASHRRRSHHRRSIVSKSGSTRHGKAKVSAVTDDESDISDLDTSRRSVSRRKSHSRAMRDPDKSDLDTSKRSLSRSSSSELDPSHHSRGRRSRQSTDRGRSSSRRPSKHRERSSSRLHVRDRSRSSSRRRNRSQSKTRSAISQKRRDSMLGASDSENDADNEEEVLFQKDSKVAQRRASQGSTRGVRRHKSLDEMFFATSGDKKCDVDTDDISIKSECFGLDNIGRTSLYSLANTFRDDHNVISGSSTTAMQFCPSGNPRILVIDDKLKAGRRFRKHVRMDTVDLESTEHGTSYPEDDDDGKTDDVSIDPRGTSPVKKGWGARFLRRASKNAVAI